MQQAIPRPEHPPEQQQQRPDARVTDSADAPYRMVADQPTLIQTPHAPAPTQAPIHPPHGPQTERPTRPTPQSADWQARCQELAWAHGLVGMAQPLGRGQFGDQYWRVPSQSQPGTVHTVRLDTRRASVHCDCVAGDYQQPCGHVGAMLFDCEAVGLLLDPRAVAPGETSAEYRAYYAWRTGIAPGRLERTASAAAESEAVR